MEKLVTKRGRRCNWRAPGEGRAVLGWESLESIPTREESRRVRGWRQKGERGARSLRRHGLRAQVGDSGHLHRTGRLSLSREEPTDGLCFLVEGGEVV